MVLIYHSFMKANRLEQLEAMLQQPPVRPTVKLEFNLKTPPSRIFTTPAGLQSTSAVQSDISQTYTQTYQLISQYLEVFLKSQSPNRWLLMPGLRGTGKTTILKQLYHHHNLKTIRRYYLSFDQVKILDTSARMLDIITALEAVLGTSLEDFTEPLILLFDEVQYIADWALGLKTVFDRCPSLFILATGSSALALQTNPDVARRVDLITNQPLSFTDFVNLKHSYLTGQAYQAPADLTTDLRAAVYQSVDHQQLFERLKALEPAVWQYWQPLNKSQLVGQYQTYGSLPYTLTLLDEANQSQRVYHAVHTMLLKDLAPNSQLQASTLASLTKLLIMMAHSESRSLNSLSKILGLNIKTITSMIHQLEQAEIIKAIRPLGAKTGHLTKPYRYLFASPALRMALADASGRLDLDSKLRDRVRGFLWEDIVGLYLRRWLDRNSPLIIEYDTQPAGADFIISTGDQPAAIVIEVGLQKTSVRQVLTSQRSVEARYSLIITNSALKLDRAHQIIYLPFEFFLLT